MLRMRVDGVTATATEKETLTAGRVGLKCAFEFAGGDWGGLFKTAVFQGVETVDVALVGNECTVPWEALATEGTTLKVGVYGANGDGDIVIPTVWANFGRIQPSAYPSGNDPSTPSQNANAYAVETAEQAKAIAESVRDDADNGVFDGFSPIATVTKSGSVATITITDENGTTTATVSDGEVGIFDAVYGTTTAAQIEAAFQLGKAIRCIKNASVLWLVNRVNDHKFYFCGINENNSNISAFVQDSGGNTLWGNTAVTLAPILGPTFTGQPKAPTAAAGTNNTQIATTAFVQAALPVAATDAPQDLAASAAVGTSAKFAREDHKHKYPSASEVGAQPAITANGILKGDGNGNITAATAETDYGTYSKPSGGIPKSDLAAAVQTSLGKADTALQSAPVTSVNGQTGAVTIAQTFIAEYGVTSVSDVLAAIAADKVVIVSDPQEDGGSFGTLFSYDTDMNSAWFIITISGLDAAIVTVDSDGWHRSTVNHPSMDDTYEPFATGTGSGATVTFSDGAEEIPLKSCSVDLDFEQSGSGDPTENNIRPITVYNAVNLVVSPTSSADDGVTYEFDLSDNPICAGTLNPLNGTLEETRICRVIDGTESWTLSTANGYRRFYKSLSALGWPAMDADAYTLSVSSHFKRKSSSTQTTDTFGAFRISQDGYVVLPDNGSRFASANELKAWFAAQYANDTPVQFAYVPAEAPTYPVTPQSIVTYLGTNNVWADSGNISLTYRKDPDIALSDAHEIAYVTYGTATSAEIEALWQAGKTIYSIYTDPLYGTQLALRCTRRNSATIHDFTTSDGHTNVDATCVNGSWTLYKMSVPVASDNAPSALGTASAGSSSDFSRGDHVHPLPLKYTTLTIATTDWLSLSCTKTVTGMTTTAIVWLEYSDTTTAFTCTQGTDSLTFGCDATPSAAVTVKVAFMEGIAL